TLAREVETARELYGNLLQRLKDVDVAEEIKISNVVVVDRASVPADPSSPRKILNLSLAGMLGLLLGAGVAFLIEYFDDTVKTPEDVQQRLRLPSLGVIPSFDNPAIAYGKPLLETPSGTSHEHARAIARTDDSGVTELVMAKSPMSI